MLDNVAGFARPIMILTGGEPMVREDIYEIAAYGDQLGLRMVMAPCGAMVDEISIEKMKQAGIQCISISLDGAAAASHDAFRGVPGAFDTAIRAIDVARRHGMPFQINTTITRDNRDELPELLRLAEELGAVTFNPFLLVPTGRGKDLAEMELSPEQYEQTLAWLADQEGQTAIQMRVTCAPHYQRIIRQQAKLKTEQSPHGHTGQQVGALGVMHSRGQRAGCMGGKSFAFISHTGKVQICGFLDIEAGDLRQNDWDFQAVWESSPFLRRIRVVDEYDGKCGYCQFRRLCGGCRARAYAMTGDPYASEPFCTHEPK